VQQQRSVGDLREMNAPFRVTSIGLESRHPSPSLQRFTATSSATQ
jgi:hypothetical protein